MTGYERGQLNARNIRSVFVINRTFTLARTPTRLASQVLVRARRTHHSGTAPASESQWRQPRATWFTGWFASPVLGLFGHGCANRNPADADVGNKSPSRRAPNAENMARRVRSRHLFSPECGAKASFAPTRPKMGSERGAQNEFSGESPSPASIRSAVFALRSLMRTDDLRPPSREERSSPSPGSRHGSKHLGARPKSPLRQAGATWFSTRAPEFGSKTAVPGSGRQIRAAARSADIGNNSPSTRLENGRKVARRALRATFRAQYMARSLPSRQLAYEQA